MKKRQNEKVNTLSEKKNVHVGQESIGSNADNRALDGRFIACVAFANC